MSIEGNYVIPMFMPTSGHGYEWVGYVFAEFDPEYQPDFADIDPVELHERGVVEVDDGVFASMQFNVLEQASLMDQARRQSPRLMITQVVSLN